MIHELLEAYRSGLTTPREVCASMLAKAREADPAIWIELLDEAALERYLCHLETISPQDLPLYGIPFAIKDNIDLAGFPTTAACPEFSYVPERSAHVVQRLIDAGAIPLGKTNLDQFATGLVGVRSPYGFPANAYHPDYIPGGSSSGSAVAVARDLVAFSLGTDTAGSGRVPAAFNNLIGLKPTRGLLSTSGVVPACRTLDSVSIFTKSVAGASTVLEVVAAQDDDDPYSRAAPRDVADFLPDSFKFGVPAELEFFGDEVAERLFGDLCERLGEIGGVAEVIDFSPFLDAARLLYEGPWVAERYLATRAILDSNPDALHPVTRAIIASGADPKAHEAFAAAYRLQACKRAADAALGRVDFILTPTTGTIYTTAQVEADPIALNSNLGYYTNFMNLLDFSAVAFPAGFYPNGHPFGATAFAPAFTEGLVLAAAARALGEPVPADLPSNTVQLAVCGAHLKGLPLHPQLESLGAKFVRSCKTAPAYRFYALPGTVPPKPGLLRVAEGGSQIEIEIYALSSAAFGEFVAAIPAPLGVGKIETDDGVEVTGFLCESHALAGAEDITALGGWRQFVARPSA